MLAPTIAFPVTTEYVKVKEGKKSMFQITFFSTFYVTLYIQVSSLMIIYIYIVGWQKSSFQIIHKIHILNNTPVFNRLRSCSTVLKQMSATSVSNTTSIAHGHVRAI